MTVSRFTIKLTAFDRFLMSFAPRYAMNRARARTVAEAVRHYEAASPGRRTSGWARTDADTNTLNKMALVELRRHARDLVRNNAWAKRGLNVIANNTVGWGIVPKASGLDAKQNATANALWKKWADSTECDAEGRRTFYAMQHQAIRCMAESGEVLIRRRRRLPKDNLTIPLQLQLIESDYLDTSKSSDEGDAGGPIIDGVEFDALGKRSAYWLFERHPGSKQGGGVSKRVAASEIIHLFYAERPEQVRGISWFGAAIVPLKDFDEYEDAELMKQKIAACFAAFVTDPSGSSDAIGAVVDDNGNPVTTDQGISQLEPGMVEHLPPGKEVVFGTPPSLVSDSFTTRNLRRIAAGLGVTYEDMTGDYERVNFSSARMARIAHYENVKQWRWHLLVPQMCSPIWQWAMEAASQDVKPQVKEPMPADWTAPPMPMIEPDKEGLAYSRLVRNGVMTHAEVIREQGGDPDAHWEEYAEGLKKLDALKITLDSDPRRTSQAGQLQLQASNDSGKVKSAAGADDKSADDTAEDTTKKSD